ncbi:MAG: ABC transporter substrate-binding protein [Candidatus Acidiferrales bacterium]
MKPRSFLFLAVISIVLAATAPLESARRPHYGGALRVEIGAVVHSLDPAVASANSEEAAAKQQIDALIYDHRNSDGTFAGSAGSGPFRIAEWEPAQRVVLAANDDYRDGRPFLDSVEIQMGRAPHDRILDLALGKADFSEIPPEQARHAAESGVRVSTSQPDELLALVFLPGRPVAEDARVREALARSVDRAAIVNFLLQKEGEPAGGLLPQWSSGTAFLFSTATDAPGAKALASQIAPSPKILLGYDSADSLEQTVAERIAVDAQEAGIAITLAAQAAPGGAANPANPDALLVRWKMPSSDPRDALANFLNASGSMAGLDPAPLPGAASPEQIYSRESAVVSSYRVVPLVWLPQVYGLSARVRDWSAPAPGDGWPLADVWLEGDAP